MDRPPFILAFAGDNQGCGYHRIVMPLASMVETGAANGRIDMMLWPDELGKAVNPDVVIWQRQVEDGQIAQMERWRQMLPDALFVYELDDYLGEIPPASFHASFMPTDISDRVRRALRFVDRVTTTTDSMAEWLRTLTDVDVIVVPNGLPAARFKARDQRKTGKLRIGFAGGISHTGDIEIIRPAIEQIGDRVEWVFFGMRPPKNLETSVEFHEGVPPSMYLDKLQSLSMDLMLAPLERNPFNRCKSNLRLVEAAAAGAAVIAQDLRPYHINKPPVYAHAEGPADWTHAIDSFIHDTPANRRKAADHLITWAGRHYALERLVKQRVAAWTKDTWSWRPQPARSDRLERTVIAYPDTHDLRTRMPFFSSVRCIAGLEAACVAARSMGADVLWMRPATTIEETSWDRMQRALATSLDIASVVPLASDGMNAFPQADKWNPLAPVNVHSLTRILGDICENRRMPVPSPTGPVIYVSANALGMLGIPDVAGADGNEEQALMEWGLVAAQRNWRHVQAVDAFGASLAAPVQPTQAAVARLQMKGLADTLRKPMEQVLSADLREQIEARLVVEQWGGPRPGSMGFGSDYDGWKALHSVQQKKLADGVEEVAFYIRKYDCERDWGADAWVMFVDDNTKLRPEAVHYISKAIRDAPSYVKVLYADHETQIAGRSFPELKPNFDLTLFMAQDYVTSVCVMHASLLTSVPVHKTDLFRILIECAQRYDRFAFFHIPEILAEITLDRHEPENIALETLERQLVLQQAYGDAITVTASRALQGCLIVKRRWEAARSEAPSVSIIIPTLGSSRLIQPCVATILQHTLYDNYEVVVVQNGPERKEPELASGILQNPHVRVLHYDGPFNWSAINNWAIAQTDSEFIVTMNDDVSVGSEHWLSDMLGYAVQDEFGVVGVKLVHPMGAIQHIGVVCHKGVAGHMHKGVPNGQPGHMGRALLSHEAYAVTGACMLFSRAKFNSAGKFDESFSHNYNDVVFCMNLHRDGFVNVVEMTNELIHPEASSRQGSSPEGMRQLTQDNIRLQQRSVGNDPYWHPSMQVSIAPGGMQIYGLNADMLVWEDFKPRPSAERVLLVNGLPGTRGKVRDVLLNGDIPMTADLSGFVLRMTFPALMNVPSWDIRNTDLLRRGLKLFKIDRVILHSLVGENGAAPPIETLRVFGALSAIDFDVVVDAHDYTLIAPWLSQDNREIAQHMFGMVDQNAWKEAFMALPDMSDRETKHGQ